MKAMILAAGRGQRMRPLTDTTPKPLLLVAEKPLIVYHLEKLAAIGITDVVINVAYLGHQIRQALGDGSTWGLSIHYAIEPEPLETAGAIVNALPLLGDQPFLLVNSDVWTDLDFSLLMKTAIAPYSGCLILVNNPEHHPCGDFALQSTKTTQACPILQKVDSATSYTFSGIALMHPSIVQNYPHQRPIFALKEVFDYWIAHRKLSGLWYQGQWCDVGTPARLQALNSQAMAEKPA